MSVSSSLLRLSALATLTALGAAQAQSFQLPSDYYNRLGGTAGVFNLGEGKYGLRYFPLPFKQDIRINFVNHRDYNEYGIQTNYKGTYITAGILEGGSRGIRTLDVAHNPWEGFQYHMKLQSSDPALHESFANYGELGYGKTYTTAKLPGVYMRFLGAAGYVGSQTQDAQFYTHVEAFATKNFYGAIKTPDKTTNLDINLATTLRNYYYLSSAKTYSNWDISIGINGNLTKNIRIYARQFERLDFGLGKLGHNIYGLADGKTSESYAGFDYQIDQHIGPLNLHAIQYDYSRFWLNSANTDNRNELRATFRLNISEPLRIDLTPGYDFYWKSPSITAATIIRLPQSSSAFGPSIKYNWLPNNNHRWGFSMVFTDKNN